MKDKLVKKNMTKFDYVAKRLGIFGVCLLILSMAVVLPISANISSTNKNISVEIQELHDEMNNKEYIVENK
jgi:hypothetical protein